MAANFIVPKRQILTKDDLEKFKESQAHEDYISFVIRLNDSVKGLKLSDDCVVSVFLSNVLEILDTVNSYCNKIPPVQNEKSRFGNPAFKNFYDQISNNVAELHENLSIPPSAIPEVSGYFVESWGNRNRLDYGTGHEANFIAWLLCFEKLGKIGPDDYVAVILKVFQKYIEVMRNLQITYWLEPAGSHGVWGLDDYHFLPFMFGSAQLFGMKSLNEFF
ncbi:8554_t:CDS:2 [Entrophospora sp. SA101]|nr:8554_t:CDS:2 [Entrophospora sp. SA101]CAJ0840158.1 8432_t:CDS:2 [Entrophospora sp. SA101]CAJ0910930.1 14434_t:CDS:2 [Entrophospora sp. SA101]